MNILVVSKEPSHPTIAGNRYIILAQAKLLKQLGHNVHFLYIHEKTLRITYIKEDIREAMISFWQDAYHEYDIPLYEKYYKCLRNIIRKCLCRYIGKCDDDYPCQLHKFVNRLDAKYHFDCCIVHYYYLSKVFAKIHIPKKVLFTHDCFSYRHLVVGQSTWRTLKPNCEAKAMQRSPYILALQDDEAVFFKTLSPQSKVYTIYGIYKFTCTDFVYNRNILFFSGGNKHNIEGLNWFLEAVFPLIVKTFPDVKLIVGGSICNQLNTYALHPNIQLYGLVDNPVNFFLLGDVAINPTRSGTGLKIKTFESLSYGKVVMVHPHSIKGIFQKDSAPLFVSDKPDEWNKFLLELWSSGNRILFQKFRERVQTYMDSLNKYVVKQHENFLKD